MDDGDAAPLFRVLGAFEAGTGDSRIALGGRKPQAVLARLLLSAGQVVSVSRLVEAAWDGSPPDSAVARIQAIISELRRRLAALGEGRELIVTRAPGYLVELRPGELDVQVFEQRSALADRLAGKRAWSEAAGQYRSALALWRGPALDGLSAPGLAAAVAALEEQRLTVLERRLAAELALGNATAVLPEVAGAVAEHPRRERLREYLMIALYCSDRVPEALDAYRAAREYLHDELGVEPGERLRELHGGILNGVPAAELTARAAPAAPASADDDQPEPAPEAIRRADVRPAQLPAPVAGFVGREASLDELDGLGSVGVVTGTAGVGKTALAVHWAHRVTDRFPDGQLYVNLRGHAASAPLRPIDALARLLRGLGVGPDRVPADEDEAATLYRSLLSGRRILVIFDNATDPDQLRPLLPGTPSCPALITSRDRLDGLVASHGARQLTLTPLPADDAVGLLGSVLGAERVQAETEAAERLARLCAHLPLALRIAAANLAADAQRTLSDHADRLASADRLAAQTVPGDPQQAVRAAFDLSYTALDSGCRSLFRLAGLVPGPRVSPGAVAAMATIPPEEATTRLDRLVAGQLVEHHDGDGYAVPELLRGYAAGLAGDSDHPAPGEAVQRLLSWYLHGVHAAMRLVHPQTLRLPPPPRADGVPEPVFADHTAAMSWLDGERANLVEATRLSATEARWREGWRLADALRGYFGLTRHNVDWLAVAEAGLAGARAAEDRRGQAAAYLCLADAYASLGRRGEAVEAYEATLALAGETGWREGEAPVLAHLGMQHFVEGRLSQAADCYERALKVSQETGQRAAEASNLTNLAGVYQHWGRLDTALDLHTQALEIHRDTGSRFDVAAALDNIGEVYLDTGRPQQAAVHYTEALAVFRELGARYAEAMVTANLAEAYRETGEHGRAADLARQAVTISREHGYALIEDRALAVLEATEPR
jgi:DNA-binding SARP family transcriptional activator/Tfp pilus assembly protein PilF